MDSPPPYCLNTSTNIGKTFFRLLGKCFPKTHQLHKFFNRNKVRVIYSSFPNFKSMINGKLSSSNCRDKTSCPLNGSCQHKNFLCSGRVSTPYIKQNNSHYIGLAKHTFRDRLYKHNNSFQHMSKRNSTELSNFI